MNLRSFRGVIDQGITQYTKPVVWPSSYEEVESSTKNKQSKKMLGEPKTKKGKTKTEQKQ